MARHERLPGSDQPRLGPALAALGIAAAATAAFAFLTPASQIRPAYGEAPAPDVMWTGYSADDVYASFEAWGDRGRELYRAANTIDFGYAAVYSTALAFALRRLVPYVKQLSGVPWVIAVPLAAGAFDIAEGIVVRIALEAFPARLPEGAIRVASVFTVAKWTLSAVAVLVLVACLVILAAQAARVSRSVRRVGT